MKKNEKEEVQFRYYTTPKDFPVFCLQGKEWKRSYGGVGYNYLHYHEQMEIGFCLDGLGKMVFDKAEFEYKTGDFTIVPGRKLHNTISKDGLDNHWSYIFLDLDQYFLKHSNIKQNKEEIKNRVSGKSLCLSSEENHTMSNLLQNALLEFKNQCSNFKDIIIALLDSFFILLYRNDIGLADFNNDEKVERKTIEKALDYISQNYMKTIRISDLSELCFISETQFRRAFGNLTGHSPVEYINGYRIKVACSMLKNSNLLIDNIAYNVGFSSIVSFYRNFKELMKTSPVKWRKSQQCKELNYVHYKIDKQVGWF